MALLVILGTAVYGGSASAEEANSSANVELSDKYIYLDPTGMVDSDDKINGADWTKSDPPTKIAYMGIVGRTGLIPADTGDDFNGCWKWKVSDIGFKKGNKIYFTYTNNWGNEGQSTNNSSTINGHNYYRTEEYSVYGDIAGTVFAQNGAANKINNQAVYALKQLTSYAGKTISFVDMTGTQSVVKVQFSTDGKYDNEDNYVTNNLDGNKSVNIPQHGLNPFQYMRFVSEDGTTALTDSIDISKAISKGGILYYGIRQKDKVYSEWSSEKKSNTAPDSVEKLYFDNLSFKMGNDVTIKIGDKDATKVETDTDVKDTLSYDLKANKITLANDTVISVTTNGTTYRFYPNGNDNLITFSGSNLCVKGQYQASAPNTVYFDATLSKLSYDKSTNTNYTMPMSETIRYHAWNSEQDFEDGFLTKMEERSDGTHTWSDVYRAELKKEYKYILFYSNSDDTSEKIPDTSKTKTANKTYDLTIPTGMPNPCFYADSSDDSTYDGKLRSGYWGELYSIRDAEGKPKDGVDGKTEAQQDPCIVDIPTDDDYTRRSDTLYVNTTLYDYYTDYELNGFNRDNYVTLNDDGVKSHRMYQPFRQFDQALSSYYESNKATSPLYWGNFQNYTGSNFQEISGTLDLYGFRNGDNLSKFYYENNSMWGIKCGLNTNGGALSNGNNATQGLVSDTLSDNNLMIKTSGSGTTEAPYFNESFLNGDNSKNTVLGKVYKNVSFPFSKVHMKSPNKNDAKIDYWYFNSAQDKTEEEISKENKSDIKNWNLRLQKDSSGKYYLKSHDNVDDNLVNGRTTDDVTDGGNYFPFNDSNQSGNASELNYGFGQRFDLKFKLAKDGKVTDSKGADVPIEFKFSGDDDVWVFIDGHLVLDIGGGHGVVNGTINFQNTDGKGPYAEVSSVKDSNDNKVNPNVKKYFKEISGSEDIMKNYDTKEHTLTMFYMERGLWESNMKITFNFPDENEFQVEKNVDTTAVNREIFPDTLFDNTSVFPFTIQNQATHFGIKQATAGQSIETKVFNDTFENNKVKNESGNTFEKVNSIDGQKDVVHWLAQFDNVGGSYKEQRWGSILPAKEDSFNAMYTAGNVKDHYKYLQFKFYYNNKDNPSTQFMYIGLEDSDGKRAGNYLTNDVATANSSLTNKKWITVNVEIDKLIGKSTIDLSKIKYIRFNYDYSRDFYLDDFKFIPSSEVTNPTGFVTKQYEIADYGSVESGTLMYPENAVYTISSDKSSTTNILEDDGVFVLANGETATFSDQFRRGSYIAVSEDVDTDVFDTSWTMYENGEPVTTVKKAGTTVDLDSSITNLTNQPGSTIKDGRKEKYKKELEDGQQMNNDGLDIPGDNKKTVGYPGVNSEEDSSAWAKKNGDANTEDANTIVFRSYSDPDNSTIATKLKVKYTNKVKTGTITIQKQQAVVSDDLKGTYTFRVKFFNVAGMGLEGTTPIQRDYDVKKNEKGAFDPIVITGIPAGTQYTISEINASDNAVLEGVAVSSGAGLEDKYKPTVTYNETTKLIEVSGTVKANADAQTKFTFTNKLKPVINIDLTKKWNNVSGVTIPDSINIQLQRCVNDSNKWEAVPYATPGQTAADYITLKKNIYNPGKTEWTFSFTGLDRYVSDKNGKEDVNKPYQYRVVEVTVDNNKNITAIEDGKYLNDLFKVTYTNAISAPSNEDESSITKNYTITNTYSPLTNIKITKVDATDTSKMLSGVEFKLEKLMLDNTYTGGDSFKVDNSFDARTATTVQGIAEFKDLEDGIYRLTETKAKEGYSLLKDPITIKINRNQVEETKVDGQSYDFAKATDKNTIELQISNRMKFLLPKTGGYGAMLFILCGMALATLCCLIFFLINLRKEVQYSRLKRQRRNAIGK